MLPTSKEPKNLQAKDQFAREWGAILHNLGTQQIETLEEDAKRIRESSQMDLTLQRGAASRLERRLEQTWESNSMIIASNSKLAAKVRAHLIASASAWRGRMVFILLEQAKTSSHLQSLATNAMEEQWRPIAASTLILIEEMGGRVR